jgi:hypothetical protein
MRQRKRALTSLFACAVATVGVTGLVSQPARASVSQCAATPASGSYSPTATATCPAGAGTFTFRVVANCYDTYPTGNLRFVDVIYGPWVQASATTSTSSSVTCYGYVPGSGLSSDAAIQTQ